MAGRRAGGWHDYPMGPGYLPKFLSYALIIMGAFIAIKSIRLGNSTIEPVRWRPFLFVLCPIVGFAYLIVTFGLVVSLLLCHVCFLLRHARGTVGGKPCIGRSMAEFRVFLFLLSQFANKGVAMVMNIFDSLATGYPAVLIPVNLLFCLTGSGSSAP